MDKNKTAFSLLYDIIGSQKASRNEKERAWQILLLIEDIPGFCILIAAKFFWRTIPNEYREKAWQELLKRNVKKDATALHYLAVNAPEEWSEKAKTLLAH